MTKAFAVSRQSSGAKRRLVEKTRPEFELQMSDDDAEAQNKTTV